MDLWSEITGPMGGMMAAAFGIGAASGYSFAQRTIISEAKKRLAEQKQDYTERIGKLEAKVEQLEIEIRESWKRGN